jgi:D-glycero-D-manno-heptose 1,7-bisphosphate phosphatase
MKNKAVFLDRDGTLNEAIVKEGRPTPPSSSEEIKLITGTKEAISLLKALNFIPVVITNQPDFARGIIKLSRIELVNEIIRRELSIEYFYMCLHDDEDNCLCRKPKAGLLLKAALDLEIDLTCSIMVGDRWRDIEAGQNVGCDCFFIDYNYNETKPNQPFQTVSSLLEVAYKIENIHGIRS